MDQKEMTLARGYLTESIELSRSTGNRIGMVRGLEAFAVYAEREHRLDLAVKFAAAAAALREAAHLPSRSAGRGGPAGPHSVCHGPAQDALGQAAAARHRGALRAAGSG